MKIGAMELIVIFIVALLVIGPDKLPQVAKRFGSALREFKKASADVTQEIREDIVEPLEDIQQPFRDALEPVEELDRTIRGDIKAVEKDLNSIGKKKKTESDAQRKTEEEEPIQQTVNDSVSEQEYVMVSSVDETEDAVLEGSKDIQKKAVEPAVREISEGEENP